MPPRAPAGHIPALPTPSRLTPLHRLAIGLAAAAVVALLARRARALSDGGAAAAIGVGAVAVGAGWGWGALLVLFFVLSAALSRLGAAEKERRTGGIVEKGGRRDAVQVLANGGVFALAAVGALLRPDPLWAALGAGALAAAAADTWATEIGTLHGGMPRSALTGRPVPVGTSGGVTAAGSLGGVAGALAVALLARALALPVSVPAVAAGGVVGALADTLLGARLQARRRCARCAAGTERIVHSCGERTVAAGGLTWMDNDVVNLLATLVGAAAAVLLARA